MKAPAAALVGLLISASFGAAAENLPADTVPALPGATVRSIDKNRCNVSLREWTRGSEKDTVAFYSKWAVSKGLRPADKPASSNADWRIWYFGDPTTKASLTLMLASDADHNFIGANYEIGSAKAGCPDGIPIR